MYTVKNFRTKKAVKEAIEAGERIKCYAPGLGTVPQDGTIYLEGPHYPEPHRWYGTGTMKDGFLIKIK